MEETTHGSEITENELLDEVMTLMVARTLGPDEITTKMFMRKMDISQRTAYNTLEKHVAAGILKSRKVYHEGHEVNAYSPAHGGWQEVLEALQE